MKRTPLRRKKPLARGNSQLKRTPMKQQSAKFRKRAKEVKPGRDALIKQQWLCECCIKRQSVCVHEIANGPNRQLALDMREVTMAVCSRCNQYELTDKGKWPVAWQLGMLRHSRPDDFNLDKANSVLIVKVSMEEVDSLPKDWWTLIAKD